jgi:hypothetical protein
MSGVVKVGLFIHGRARSQVADGETAFNMKGGCEYFD